MAKLPILHFPDPRLRTRAKPVSKVDDNIRRLADDMLETMYDAPGIGLAATQVNQHIRLLVLDISEDKTAPQVFINPVITPLTADCVPYEEGCLSVPGSYDEVQRPARIRVEALDRDGKPFTLETDGLLAVCLQHEVDHLEGKLFVDYLSPLKRQRIKTKLEKLQKQRA